MITLDANLNANSDSQVASILEIVCRKANAHSETFGDIVDSYSKNEQRDPFCTILAFFSTLFLGQRGSGICSVWKYPMNGWSVMQKFRRNELCNQTFIILTNK